MRGGNYWIFYHKTHKKASSCAVFCCKALRKRQSTQEVGKITRLRLVFSPTLLSCSTASCILYNRTQHSRGFFICLIVNTLPFNSVAHKWRHDSDKTRTNKLEWWMILKISLRAKGGVPKTLLELKHRLNFLYFPQNTLMLTESREEFSDLHSIFRLRALRYCWVCHCSFKKPKFGKWRYKRGGGSH